MGTTSLGDPLMSNAKLLHQLNHGPLTDGLALLPQRFDSIRARALILKIVLQESMGIYRDQLERDGRNTVLGPALGLGQFERGGACTSLLKHPVTKPYTHHVLKHFDIPITPDAFWRALKVNDTLAMAACRINLMWLPQALPDIDDEHESHEQYVQAWQPGAWTRGSKYMKDELLERWHRIHMEVNNYLRTGD